MARKVRAAIAPLWRSVRVSLFGEQLACGKRPPRWAAKPPVPRLVTRGLDFTRSALTGYSRATYEAVATDLLRNALSYARAGNGPLLFPGTPHVVERDPGGYEGPSGDYVEDFSRTLLLATPLLARAPELSLHGRPVASRFQQWLIRGTDPRDSAYFGAPQGTNPTHHICEAAAVAICLMQAPVALWEPLSRAERAAVCAWFRKCQAAPVFPNNWRWFNVMLDVFLRRIGEASDRSGAAANLSAIRAMHVDGGWFRDGARFDYYSAWAMQFYPILWAEWEPEPAPAVIDEFYSRNDEFLATYQHVFSREGRMPAWGRSASYRFAATAPFALAFRRSRPPAIDPGFARRLCSGNMSQFVEDAGFLQGGLPSLGFREGEDVYIDRYLSTSSPLWCAKTLWALTLPDNSAFWTAAENEGFWSAPPSRVEFGTTGIAVEHDAVTGETRLYPPKQVAEPRYARYELEVISTGTDSGRGPRVRAGHR